MSKRALILDSTQLESFGTCPEHWNLSTQQQLERADAEARRPMIIGTYGHKLMEIYYKAKARNESQSQALEAALSYDVDQPEPFPLEAPDRTTVKKQFTLYTYTNSSNDIIPNSPESVEVGFSEEIFQDDEWIYILEGRIDLLGISGGQEVFMDHKYQLRTKNLYKKSIQFRNYAMVTQKTIGIINYVRLTKEVTKDTFKRDPISFSTLELRWWKGQLIQLFHNIRFVIRDNELINNGFEHRWSACSGKYGYPCEFATNNDKMGICDQGTMGEINKKQFYQIKKEWKPW